MDAVAKCEVKYHLAQSSTCPNVPQLDFAVLKFAMVTCFAVSVLICHGRATIVAAHDSVMIDKAGSEAIQYTKFSTQSFCN